MWITAVNSHDYSKVYDLAPEQIRDRISRSDFLQEQNNNSFLAPGNIIRNYTVMNRNVTGDNAVFTVQLVLSTPASGTTPAEEIPLYIDFVEFYENGGWKVWTTSPMG